MLKKILFSIILFFICISICFPKDYSDLREDFLSPEDYMEQRMAIGGYLNEYLKKPIEATSTEEVYNILYKLQLTPYPLSIYTTNKLSWNAFTLPGGVIIVAEDLWNYCSEDERMFILLHEYSHSLLGHGFSTRNTGIGLIILNIIAGIATQGMENRDLAKGIQIATAAGSILYISNYSQGNEEEADLTAIKHLQILGYDPYSSVRVFKILGQKKPGTLGDKNLDGRLFFSLKTHPSLEDRIEYCTEEIQETDPTLALYISTPQNNIQPPTTPTTVVPSSSSITISNDSFSGSSTLQPSSPRTFYFSRTPNINFSEINSQDELYVDIPQGIILIPANTVVTADSSSWDSPVQLPWSGQQISFKIKNQTKCNFEIFIFTLASCEKKILKVYYK